MEKLGQVNQAKAAAFIRKADNGSIKTDKERATAEKKEVHQYLLILGEEQKAFFQDLVERTGFARGFLVWQALLFCQKEPISADFLNEHINFIYNKRYGKTRSTSVAVQKVLSAHDDLKRLNKHYKDLGYNIGNKGVALLYLLFYAKEHLKMDISHFRNFSE